MAKKTIASLQREIDNLNMNASLKQDSFDVQMEDARKEVQLSETLRKISLVELAKSRQETAEQFLQRGLLVRKLANIEAYVRETDLTDAAVDTNRLLQLMNS